MPRCWPISRPAKWLANWEPQLSPFLISPRAWTVFAADARRQKEGGKLNDLSSELTHTLTCLVRRLFSTSLGSGMGAKGLTSMVRITPLEPRVAPAFMIEYLFTGP